MQMFDSTIQTILNERLEALEKHFDADIVFYVGPIFASLENLFRDSIEKLRESSPGHDNIVIFLNTPGGSAETVEKMVEIIRFHYKEVSFVVPDCAMSAGTIFCMSGNKIWMDYSSSLGPIDPQVYNGQNWVPALGYLDQVDKMIEKAREGTLTHAEFAILQSQDLAMLNSYEQQKNLTTTLLTNWLVEYKFKDWVTHTKTGQAVTPDEKLARAKSIAQLLGDNKTWHSHGRFISAKTLREGLRLKIEDYSTDLELRSLIRSYNDILIEYVRRNNWQYYLHSKHLS